MKGKEGKREQEKKGGIEIREWLLPAELLATDRFCERRSLVFRCAPSHKLHGIVSNQDTQMALFQLSRSQIKM